MRQPAPAQRCLRLLYNLFHSAFTSQHPLPPHTLPCCSLFPVRPFSMSVIDTLAECVHKGKRQLCSLWALTQRRIGRSTHPPVPPLILFATLRNAVGHVQINGYFSTLCNLQTLSFSPPPFSRRLSHITHTLLRAGWGFGKVEN